MSALEHSFKNFKFPKIIQGGNFDPNILSKHAISLTGAPRIIVARVHHSQIMLWSHDKKHDVKGERKARSRILYGSLKLLK